MILYKIPIYLCEMLKFIISENGELSILPSRNGTLADTDKLYQDLQVELLKATREAVYLDIIFKELTLQYTT